jgi:HD-GYP domain-containing protein (c-di-GMP phosphodiesterase class II)
MPEEEISINQVNTHYLDKVMDLAEEMDVEATEDIFDSRGMKLVAKGAKISRNLQEKLIMHKLKKPLESSITVEGGVDGNMVVNQAEMLAETVGPVRCMHDAVGNRGVAPLTIMKQTKFGSAMSMMLTITERGGESALAHSVMVSLVSICLAKKMGLSDADQATVALAGLLHDIGELYIEPDYLKSNRRLLPHEWRHVVVHPRIGQMLISELEHCPPGVAQAVAEHHERFDGGGYPRQVSGKNISIAGQVLSVAEMISGVFTRKDKPLERAELALKIIPGEHARELVSAVSEVLRISQSEQDAAQQAVVAQELHGNVRQIYESIGGSLDMGRLLLDASPIKSKQGKDLLLNMLNQANVVKRAFSSTGLDLCLGEDLESFSANPKEIHFEADVASREIRWRLRDIARNLALHSSGLSQEENDAFQPLIVLLDEGKQTSA